MATAELGVLTPLGIVGLVATLLTSLVLGLALRRGLDVAIKPSFVAALTYHVIVQWPAMLRSGEVQEFLGVPGDFVLLVHGFGVLLAVLAVRTVRAPARAVWDRILAWDAAAPAVGRLEILVVLALLAAATAVYLAYVPWTSTGLYAILFDPSTSKEAREASLKLLENPVLAYMHLFAAKVLAPVLACLLVLRPLPSRGRALAFGARVCVFVFAVAAASLSGARMFPLLVTLAAAGAFMLKDPRRIRVPLLVAFAVLGLYILAAQSRLREGEALTPGALTEYAFVNVLWRRVLGATVTNGMFTVDFAQLHGFLGAFGWPRLADLYGFEPTSLGSAVYQAYYLDSPVPSGVANTSMVFVYYAYFGLVAIPIAVLLALSLDVVVPLAGRLSPSYTVCLLVVTALGTLSLTYSEFTTALVTHGILTGILFVTGLAFAFGHIRRPERRGA
ncbi:MAG TPA: hypothetical protein VI997_07465 [Candidatus Thermoplasmatota archaeon]|nr:hypothetical protein [Candidatus Thermoplasmatota archaeon]